MTTQKGTWRWLSHVMSLSCLGILLLSGVTAAASLTDSLRVSGTNIATPSGKPIILRGFNVCWWIPPTAQDADDIKALGANCIRYMFGYTPTGKFNPSQVSEVRTELLAFTSRGLWVIPVVHDFRRDGHGPYDDPAINREFLEMWDYVFQQLKDEPRIAAWEPINEPHDSTDEAVDNWYVQVVAHFRQLDPRRPIVVEGNGYSWPEDLKPGLKQSDTNIIYAFHTYGPWEYVSQKRDSPVSYPGKWSKADLASAIQPAVAFREKFSVPVWCGEFGVPTKCPGWQQWIPDVASILDEDRLPWCYWAWALQPKDPTLDTFDVNKQKPEAYNTLKKLFITK